MTFFRFAEICSLHHIVLLRIGKFVNSTLSKMRHAMPLFSIRFTVFSSFFSNSRSVFRPNTVTYHVHCLKTMKYLFSSVFPAFTFVVEQFTNRLIILTWALSHFIWRIGFDHFHLYNLKKATLLFWLGAWSDYEFVCIKHSNYHLTISNLWHIKLVPSNNPNNN